MKTPRTQKLGIALIAVFYILLGALHFIIPEFYLKLMPDYIPAGSHRVLVYISGLAEIILGFGIANPTTRRLSAWGIIALLISVFPANVYAFTSDIDFNTPKWALFLRLPFQGILIYWAYRYTRHKSKE